MYRLGRRCTADFIALLDQVLRAFPRSPVIVVICDNDSIHHARKVTTYLEEHPRLRQIHSFFRNRSPGQMLATAAP